MKPKFKPSQTLQLALQNTILLCSSDRFLNKHSRMYTTKGILPTPNNHSCIVMLVIFFDMYTLLCVNVSCSVLPYSLRHHGLQTARLLCPWNFPAKNTRVSSHSLLQEIFLTQGLNLGFLHCRQILYCLNHQEILYAYSKCSHGSINLELLSLKFFFPF